MGFASKIKYPISLFCYSITIFVLYNYFPFVINFLRKAIKGLLDPF